MESAESTFSRICGKCDAEMYAGFARCQNPDCGALRDEFRGYESVVVPTKGYCFYSGAITDVQLPNGNYIWAPYFIDFIRGGWLGPDLRFTDKFIAESQED